MMDDIYQTFFKEKPRKFYKRIMVPFTLLFLALLVLEWHYQLPMRDFSIGRIGPYIPHRKGSDTRFEDKPYTPFTLMWWQERRTKVMNIIMLGFTNLVNPNAIVGILIIALFVSSY